MRFRQSVGHALPWRERRDRCRACQKCTLARRLDLESEIVTVRRGERAPVDRLLGRREFGNETLESSGYIRRREFPYDSIQ